jgi:nucleoside-diphosphate-sugar epimerase
MEGACRTATRPRVTSNATAAHTTDTIGALVHGKLLILGCGYAGSAAARRARAEARRVIATVRDPARVPPLEAAGVEVLVAPALDRATVGSLVDAETDVLVTFPPDDRTDEAIAPATLDARGLVYLSTTGVYDAPFVDDATPVSANPSARAARRLAAEVHWRAVGATILRTPAIYGPDRGLHVRVRSGRHRIPGDGRRTISRIHVEDLASFALAAMAVRNETFVVGDLAPAPHIEVVRFVCERARIPMPPHAPIEEVDESLRADRRVDPTRAIARLGVALRYPSYRDGFP